MVVGGGGGGNDILNQCAALGLEFGKSLVHAICPECHGISFSSGNIFH